MNSDQHFMIDEALISNIIAKIPCEGKVVLEIGPGKGALTFGLAKKARKVIAIETDLALGEQLQKKLPAVEVIVGNALDFDVTEGDIIVSNLPYSISEPFFYQLVRATRSKKISAIYLTTGMKFFELLNTDAIKLGEYAHRFFSVKGFFEIPPMAFDPMPDVQSIFFELVPKYPADVVSQIILQDDKKLKNACEDILSKTGLTKRQSKEKVAKLGEHLLDKRIGHLSNQQFLQVIEFLRAL